MFIEKINSLYSEVPTDLGNILKNQEMVYLVDGMKDGMLNKNNFDPFVAMKAKLFTALEVKSIRNLDLPNAATFLSGGAAQFNGADSVYTIDTISHRDRISLSLPIVEAGKLARNIGFNKRVTMDGTSCSSGNKSLFDIKMMMDLGYIDSAILWSADDAVNTAMIGVFDIMKATVTKEKEAAGFLPSAFDSKNHGFYMGQAMSYMILTKEKTKNSIAEILGVSMQWEDYSNPLGQSPGGEGYESVIRDLFGQTGLKSQDIDFIKSHGSGTVSNNQSEGTAIRKMFGKSFKANSYKQYIGHTLGVNVGVEMDMVISDATKGIMRKIKNRTEADENFLSEDYHAHPEIILSLSAGVGNNFGGNIIRML